MLGVLVLVLALQAAPPAPSSATVVARQVARVLLRQEEPDPGAIAAGAAEIARLGDVSGALFDALGTHSVRADGGEHDGEDVRLSRGQMAVLLAAVELLAPAKRAGFVAEVQRAPARAERVTAALRVLGVAHPPDARAMLALAQAAEAHGLESGFEDALEDALPLALARGAASLETVANAWRELGPLAASTTVRVLERQRTAEALACLRALLGRRPEYDACLLVAIGNALEPLPLGEVESLAGELECYLRRGDSSQAQAAATALGRLGHPGSVPCLIERLESEDLALARAALGALRTIGGAALPDSVGLWRGWYAREESWRQERAPELIEALGRDRKSVV